VILLKVGVNDDERCFNAVLTLLYADLRGFEAFQRCFNAVSTLIKRMSMLF